MPCIIDTLKYVIHNMICALEEKFNIEGSNGSFGKGVPLEPGVAQRVPGGLGSQIFMALEGGEVVTLMHRPSLPPGVFLVLIFTRG
jgi:hypothetical protein